MSLATTLLAFIVALGVLVVVHELGHYSVARLCGVKVLRFAVGFGPVLASRRAGQDSTEWALCAIPLGGYVKMLDEREDEVQPAEVHRAFNRQTVWKRIAIVLAGPLANFLLAIVFYQGLFMAGSMELKAQIGQVLAGSAAEKAGLVADQLITSVDGEPVRSWNDLLWRMADHALDGGTVELRARDAGGAERVHSLSMQGVVMDEGAPDILRQAGLTPRLPQAPAVAGAIQPGSPAERAGLRKGDRIIALDETGISSFSDFAERVAANPGKRMRVTVSRGDETVVMEVVAESIDDNGKPRGRLGVAAAQLPASQLDEYRVLVQDGFGAALGRAVQQTWETAAFSLKAIARMITGDLSWRNVSGPVTIADYAGQSAQYGWEAYLRFLAFFSVSLGTLNLLPVPVLDGGHLLYYLAEAIRGKPLSERLLELGQRAGLALLASLMVLALFNDVRRLVLG